MFNTMHHIRCQRERLIHKLLFVGLLFQLLVILILHSHIPAYATDGSPVPILPKINPNPTSAIDNKHIKGVVNIPVLYATDREIVGEKLVKHGSTIASLRFGHATVTVPAQSDWLKVNAPTLNKRLQVLGWTYNLNEEAQKPYIEERGYVAEKDSAKLVNLKCPSDFWKSLDFILDSSASDELFVYIHGFASSGNNAIYSTGVLSSQLEAPVICFTWPSLGIVGLKGKVPFLSKNRISQNFKRDKQIIDDPKVCGDLHSMMEQIKQHVGSRKRISIIAHSLGNRLLINHLNQHTDSPVVFKRLILIAPDVNRDLFSHSLDNVLSHSEYVAVFTNPKDKVLLASSMRDLFAEKQRSRKLGKSKGNLPGIDYVDYSAIAEPRGLKYLSLRHYIPFEHLASLLKVGKPANLNDKNHYVLINRRVIKETKRSFSAPNAIGLGDGLTMKCRLLELQKQLNPKKLQDQPNSTHDKNTDYRGSKRCQDRLL